MNLHNPRWICVIVICWNVSKWRSVDSVYSLFQITNLMHNSFILQQYVCYTTILNMFRATRFPSSGGQIVSPQPLVSSPSVNSHTVCRLRADCWSCGTFIYISERKFLCMHTNMCVCMCLLHWI